MIELLNTDSLEYMAKCPDKSFDLAICDVNYGIGEDGEKNHSRSNAAKAKEYTPKNWDKESVTKKMLDEIIRVSKNQIIWGANHFISKMPYDSSCWIIWNKLNGDNDFADCELAWTSFNTAVRNFNFRWAGMLQGDMKNKQQRIHPTEKPIQLYEWLISNYAKKGQSIIDTHLGSASIALAIHNANEKYDYKLNFVGCEIDIEYYNDSINRYNLHISQKTLQF